MGVIYYALMICLDLKVLIRFFSFLKRLSIYIALNANKHITKIERDVNFLNLKLLNYVA